jgi:hypothetical protein
MVRLEWCGKPADFAAAVALLRLLWKLGHRLMIRLEWCVKPGRPPSLIVTTLPRAFA